VKESGWITICHFKNSPMAPTRSKTIRSRSKMSKTDKAVNIISILALEN
jgi:hypothetical protein